MLTITRSKFDKSKNGFLIKGITTAFALVEGINISFAVTKRLHWKNTLLLATADQSGQFSFIIKAEPGELIRLRSFSRNKYSPWLIYRIPDKKQYNRDPELAHFRVGLTSISKGKVWIFNLDPCRPVGEPHTKLILTNLRTKKKTVIQLDRTGTFLKRSYIQADIGDSLTIANHGNAGTGTLIKVPGKLLHNSNKQLIQAPKLCFWGMEWTHTPKFDLAFFKRPLFSKTIKPEDVRQGEICNCHLAAAASSLAHSSPQRLKKIIQKKSDNLYTVKLKVYNKRKSKFEQRIIEVTGEFYVRPNGALLYADSRYKGKNSSTLWWPVLEKAYAILRGNYEKIGTGGFANELMAAVLGRPGTHYTIAEHSTDAVWKMITKKLQSNLPIALTTYSDRHYKRYTHIHVFSNHCYSLIGAFAKGSVRYLKLRNPWGEVTPEVADETGKGIFVISLEAGLKLFEGMYTVVG